MRECVRNELLNGDIHIGSSFVSTQYMRLPVCGVSAFKMEFKDFAVANRLGFVDSVFRIYSSFTPSGERQKRYVADTSVVLETFAIYLLQNNLIPSLCRNELTLVSIHIH